MGLQQLAEAVGVTNAASWHLTLGGIVLLNLGVSMLTLGFTVWKLGIRRREAYPQSGASGTQGAKGIVERVSARRYEEPRPAKVVGLGPRDE